MVEPKYIGHSFNTRYGLKLDHFGPIFATPEAFFLTIGARPAEPLVGATVEPLGLTSFDPSTIGQRINSAFESNHKRTEHANRDRPFILKGGGIVVVPRGAIDRIHYGFWSSYDLVCGDRTFCIALSFLARSSTLAALREMGWDEKLDRAGSPSVVRQLAPLWGLLLGASIGAGIKLAMGAPLLEGRGAAIEFAAIGAGLGLLVGCIYHVWPREGASA